MSQPNLLIAGAQKSGTSWLHSMLAHHPDIAMSQPKEIGYFDRSEEDYAAGWQDYLAHWSGDDGDKRWRGESTPHYFWKRQGPFAPAVPHDAAQRIHQRLGDDLTVIVALRDPVGRAVSGYWHNFSHGRFDLTTSLFRLPPAMGIIDLGFYRRHYEHWASTFSRVNVLLYDDLVANPRAFLGDALAIIGASPDAPGFDPPVDERVHTKRWLAPFKRRTPIEPVEVAALLDLYRDDIAFVEHLTQRELPSWRDLDGLIRAHCGVA